METRNIKDYLPLYLGCDFVLRINNTEKFSGVMQFNVTALSAAYSVKDKIYPVLLLRPLSSMTEEDYAFINDGYNNSNKHNIFGQYEWEAEQTYYLLSKHFDLFNLIPDGIALDKTKI